MSKYCISKILVTKLWGYKEYELSFYDDVNIIIGPNASGKTTLINILFNSLNGHFRRLCEIDFAEIEIVLKEFNGTGECKLRFVKKKQFLDVFLAGKKEVEIPFHRPYRHRDDGFSVRADVRELQLKIRELVPAVWLPVSRQLPISEREWEQEIYSRRRPLESVDKRLSDLVKDLEQYRISLDAELSEFRKEFQQKALENILYNKNLDSFRHLKTTAYAIAKDLDHYKTALQKTFDDVGIDRKVVKNRITKHFSTATNAIAKLGGEGIKYDDEMIFIIPLIIRTKSIVDFADTLESQRKELFTALSSFKTKVNSFLHGKTVEVSDKGELLVSSEHLTGKSIKLKELSSGEKQILILLIQALLSEKNPVVYVADEPEISLHIEWQEKLLSSLVKLSGKCQFIVATHSPDIVSGFGEKVHDLARFQ